MLLGVCTDKNARLYRCNFITTAVYKICVCFNATASINQYTQVQIKGKQPTAHQYTLLFQYRLRFLRLPGSKYYYAIKSPIVLNIFCSKMYVYVT